MAIRLILFLFCSISFSPLSHAQWSQVSGPFGGEVFFLQKYAGAYWAGAQSGLYRSTDGTQWNQVTTIGNNPVVAGLVDNDTLYILRSTTSTNLLTTIDGGQTWRSTLVVNAPSIRMAVLRKAAGYLIAGGVSYAHEYLRSKDNGFTFQHLPNNGPSDLNMFDASGTLLVPSNNNGLLSVSTDGGTSVVDYPLPAGANRFSNLVITDSAIIIRAYAFGTISFGMYMSFDRGATWQTLPLPPGFTPPYVTALYRTGKKGVMVGTYNQYAYTEDHGVHWQVFTAPVAPRQIFQTGNSWLISSANGFYNSSDAGATWANASQGFPGHIISRIYTAGNRLYAVISNEAYIGVQLYYTETGSGSWSKIVSPTAFNEPDFAFQGADTIVAYNQLSLDGGLTWTPISYFGVPNFYINDIDIHNNQAYIPIADKIYVVPLQPSPTADFFFGPNNDYCLDVLFAGDTLYVTTHAGQIFRKLPNTFNWTLVATGTNINVARLYHMNDRFFQPRLSDILYADNGINWQSLAAIGLPLPPANEYIVSDLIEVNNSVIVAATPYNSLFFSTDKGEHWWPFQSGLPDDVTMSTGLAQNSGKIYAAMSGNGIWERELQIGSSSGIVYRDDNQNGIKESIEPLLPNQKVLAVQSDNLALTDDLGRYQLIIDLAADTVRAILPVPYGTVQPASRLVQGVRQGQDFGFWFQSDVTDLAIFATNTAAVRPGFENTLHLSITNAGTSQSGATVGVKLPIGTTYLSADPQPTTVIGDSLIWHLTSVPFLGTVDIEAQFQVGTNVILGQTLSFHATVTPSDIDLYSADNDFTLKTIVVGSYDPNDKQVWPGPIITPGQVTAGEPLHYTIRFQNTGTYLAERIRLVDTLHAHLDLSSLAVVGASHPYTWRILSGHVLEILFEHIQLPDSNSNQAGSHGFFSFSIQAKRNLALGTLLTNKAYIYFDFNVPIITNTVATEVSEVLGVSGAVDQWLSLKIAPNPANTRCTVHLPGAGGALALFNGHGSLLRWLPACPEQVDVDVHDLPTGVYFLRWQKGEARGSKSIIITH